MKKLLAGALLIWMSGSAAAQDLDEIRNLAILGQHAKAKEMVDKYLSVEKNAKKPDGWFYKGYIINQLSKEAGKSVEESSNMKLEAFELMKKYRSMAPKAELLEEQNNSPFFDIYVGLSSDLAIKAYNDKNIAAAHDNFKKGLEVHDYLFANNITGAGGFKFAAIDTVLTLYTAITANELKQPDVAATYYRKLADANVEGKDYVEVYQTLAEIYRNQKNQVAFEEILAKGRKLYPAQEEYWTAVEIENALNGLEKQATFPKYEELLAKYPRNYTIAYNYAVELYNYYNSDESKTADRAALKSKLETVLKTAIDIQSTFDANFIMANHLYYASFDVSDEARKIRGPKPEDLKKKKALEADAMKLMNDAATFAATADELFATVKKPKTTDKVHHKQVVTILKNVAEVKKDAAKVAEYDKRLKEME